jgi:hypothetical protein
MKCFDGMACMMPGDCDRAGKCAKPLLGWNPGVGPRCRLCNTQAYKVTPR